MAKMNGTAVLVYSIVALLIHIGFIVYSFWFMAGDTGCSNINGYSVGSFVGKRKFGTWMIWCVIILPIIVLVAFYTLCFRICRSFFCSCWACCGNDKSGQCATKCKICFEGLCGNPIFFAIAFIAWGAYEFFRFKGCDVIFYYAFLANLAIVSIALLLLCVYYYVRVRRRMQKRRLKRIKQKGKDNDPEYVAEDDENFDNDYFDDNGMRGGGGGGGAYGDNNMVELQAQQPRVLVIQAPPPGNRGRGNRQEREGAGEPLPHQPQYVAHPPPQQRDANNRRFSMPMNSFQNQQQIPNQNRLGYGIAQRPEKAFSDAGAMRRHSYNPNVQQAPQRVAFVPFGDHNNNDNNARAPAQNPAHAAQESISIEISIKSANPHDDDLIGGVGHTRGPSLSFPNEFLGFARRVSSGILKILKQIDAEPECAICMDDLALGNEMGQLQCGHTFHKECIIDWLGNDATCPNCRMDVKNHAPSMI